MTKQRLEAFSDGVIAILITIMILELKVPHGTDWTALTSMLPRFLTYVLSFIILGIYWNNHHHMFQTVGAVSGRILWANHHLLFWLSLVPVTTGWMGEGKLQPLPTAVYGVVLICSAVAYTLLQAAIVAHQGQDSALASAVGGDVKGKLSLAAYAGAIPLAFVSPTISVVLYALVALMWLIPDRRIESRLSSGIP
jgi:uncharacterized membrane protein